MRKAILIVVVLLLIFSCCACGGSKADLKDNSSTENQSQGNQMESLTDILIQEKWCESKTGDPEIAFYKTGTGRFKGSSGEFGLTWQQIEGFDNCIRMEYEFMLGNGAMTKGTTDFELKEVDGKLCLESMGEGNNYVRVSDFSE